MVNAINPFALAQQQAGLLTRKPFPNIKHPHSTPIHHNNMVAGKPLRPQANAQATPSGIASSALFSAKQSGLNPFSGVNHASTQVNTHPEGGCTPRMASNRGLYSNTSAAGDVFQSHQRHDAGANQMPMTMLQKWLSPLGVFTK